MLSVASLTAPTAGTDESSTPAMNQYLRWNKDGENSWNLQTAVITFRRRKQRKDGSTTTTSQNVVYGDDDYETVELHAQLHFGEKEYFEYFNSSPEMQQHDAVHYELLVDEALLETKGNENSNKRRRQVRSAIMASPNDQSLARDYGKEQQC